MFIRARERHRHIAFVSATWKLCSLAVVALAIAAPANAQDAAAGERKHGICASCHGIEGRSAKNPYPILAAQKAPYLFRQLDDFQHGRRSDPSMNAVVPQLTTQDMLDLAAFFASRTPASSRADGDRAALDRGKRAAGAARCMECHSASRHGGRNEAPRIEGQHHDYLAKQLRDFRTGKRTNDRGVMAAVAASLSDADIDDLATYFAARTGETRREDDSHRRGRHGGSGRDDRS